MTERERIIRGLEICLTDWQTGDAPEVLDDAIGILKARVLKLSEIPEWDGAVWIEHRNIRDYIEPCLYRYEQQPFFRFAGKDHAWGIDLSTATYKSEWRAWTCYPSEEERQEVEWT